MSELEEELSQLIICECGEKTIAEAIEIFRNSPEPYRKAKKEVTGCNKTCCKVVLQKLYDMVYFGKVDIKEIARIMDVQSSYLEMALENLKSEY